MPFIRQKHCCSLCGTEYNSFENALACENLGVPAEVPYIEGSALCYSDEESGMGVRGSYTTKANIVLFRQLGRVNKAHIWIYVVDDTFGENMVFKDNAGSFISPAESKHNKGFAEALKQKAINHNLYRG